MRRRSMLMTLAGAGVSLCVPFAARIHGANSSLTQGTPEQLERETPDEVRGPADFEETIRTVRSDIQRMPRGAKYPWNSNMVELERLCEIVLERYAKGATTSPAILQRCADLLAEIRGQLYAYGKTRWSAVADFNHIQLIAFVA